MEDQLLRVKNNVIATVLQVESLDELNRLHIKVFGKSGDFTLAISELKNIPKENRARLGVVINEVKQSLEEIFARKRLSLGESNLKSSQVEFFDVSIPGIRPPIGHLHMVSQAIAEITRIFERIGFTRVRHPEVDWDYYAFEALNMPPDHPARDEWETFFIEHHRNLTPRHSGESAGRLQNPDSGRAALARMTEGKGDKIVLTPHTSNGQVREMEKGILPIRMINIAKCYRRQSDVSHVPMFHQFEGLYVDKNVSIGHLKGVLDYFVKQFFGPNRQARIRPFHFQFTEPSFEVDISCDICNGRGCRLCKEGWLELGGAGMVHPVVLQNGGVDTSVYNGFAFGWGVERTFMMKSGTKLDDIRILYSNDVRFLEQF